MSIVSHVGQAIYDKYSETAFKFLTITEEWKKVAQDFSGKWNLRHCCGCIDGKHVTLAVSTTTTKGTSRSLC